MKRPLGFLVVVVLTVAGCGLSGSERPHQEIGSAAATLRAAFNAYVSKTRIVALMSPTCGTCLNAATEMQHDVFDKVAGSELAAFMVWVPKKGAHEGDVSEATRLIPDTRAANYWDGSGYLVQSFRTDLGLDQDAWDVYMVYPPGVRWTGATPPTPAYWMQQLSPGALGPGQTGKWLDGPLFAGQVRATMQRAAV